MIWLPDEDHFRVRPGSLPLKSMNSLLKFYHLAKAIFIFPQEEKELLNFHLCLWYENHLSSFLSLKSSWLQYLSLFSFSYWIVLRIMPFFQHQDPCTSFYYRHKIYSLSISSGKKRYRNSYSWYEHPYFIISIYPGAAVLIIKRKSHCEKSHIWKINKYIISWLCYT